MVYCFLWRELLSYLYIIQFVSPFLKTVVQRLDRYLCDDDVVGLLCDSVHTIADSI